jgi:glycosyltransferase involved in cell wall biosynthesis
LPQREGIRWPKVTVVTPSLNQGRFIEATIRSILLQGYPDLEYIVLDGGSTDNTVEVIRKYSPWIDFWVSEPDGGQSAAINRGLKMGSGVHAIWINSDDMLCRNALVSQARLGFDKNVIYVGDCLYMNGDGQTTSHHRGRIHSFNDLISIKEIWRSGGHLVQPEVLFPRERALAFGGLNADNHFTMDYELWGKFLLANVRFQYTEIPFAMFRRHEGQKTHDAIRQTRSLVDTVGRLLAEAIHLPIQDREEIRLNLQAYIDEHAVQTWESSGRLARLGLPASIVTRTREFKGKLLNAAKGLGLTGS